MALHFGFEKINGGNFTEVVYDPSLDADGNQEVDKEGKKLWRIKSVTDSLIWSTLWLGISEITEKNYKKFYQRLRLWNDNFGPHIYYSEVPNAWAAWMERDNGNDQYLVASKTVRSAVNFCRNHYAEELGGQDDPEFWKKIIEDAEENFEHWPHGEFSIEVEGEEGEVRFMLRGSELLSDRRERDAITLQVVKDHIGLWTNASTKTEAQFRKEVWKKLEEKVQWKIEEEEKELESAREDG